MTERPFDPVGLRAIVFDLDGTLYRQNTLRRGMLVRLVRAYALRPVTALRTARVLAAYRRAQDVLRAPAAIAEAPIDLAEAQIELACSRTHATHDFVTECIARWMDSEPLALIGRCIQPDLVDFLSSCRTRGLRLGVLSDYPAAAKLAALGLSGIFDVVVSAQSPEIGVFKPHPRGLLHIADRLGVRPSECVYVGDRAEVDGLAAAAAGMACFILTQRVSAQSSGPWLEVAGFRQLKERLNRPSTAAERPLLSTFTKI